MHNHKSYFGLPGDIKICDSCTYTNQKPNSAIEFRFKKDSLKDGIEFLDNICSACGYSKKKDSTIDWEKRENELKAVCDKFRSRNGSYDCVVPGSGGKDSYVAANVLKYKFNMNPITVTWAPHEYTTWGWINFKNWIDGGFPNYLYHPNGAVHRLLSRLAMDNLYHPFQPFILGQYSFPIRAAKLLNIPLIFYGENSAEYGNRIQDNESATRRTSDISYKNLDEVYLAGESVKEIGEKFNINLNDFIDYLPLQTEDFIKSNIEWHYLGYYMKWHPHNNYYLCLENNFKPSRERNEGSYGRYASMDDMMDDINYYCLYIKYGLGRSSYETAQEIRRGDITREEGLALVNKYDGEPPKRFKTKIFDYLSINKIPNLGKKWSNYFESPEFDENYFIKLTDSFRSPHLWYKNDQNKWSLRYKLK